MSPLSNRLEALAELHCVDVLVIQEWWAERAAIREYDGNTPRHRAEQLALRDVEDELEGRHTQPDVLHAPHGNRPPADTGSSLEARTGQSDASGEVRR